MSVTGISEFTFGFAFLYEQTQKHWSGLTAAPILPSLRKEAGASWDARIPTHGTDYYYQFKLSELLHASHAKYIKDGTYHSEYFPISIHRRFKNRQHNRLHSLGKKFANTYYVAPEIRGLENFNDAFLSGQVENGSRLIPAGRCKRINDGKQHYITFQEGNPNWLEHSNVVRHTKSYFGKEIEELYRSSELSQPIDREFARRLRLEHIKLIRTVIQDEGRLFDDVLRLIEKEPEEDTRLGHLRRVSELVSTFYGATLVIVGPSPNSSPEA